MKLLMVAPVPPPYGGIANWVRLLEKRISDDPTIRLTEILDISPHKRESEGRTLFDRVVVQGLRMFQLRKQLIASVQKERPDVIHMTTSGSLAILRDILLLKAAHTLGVPVVYHLHFGRVPQMAAANSLEWRLLQRAMKLAAMTLCMDEGTYQTLQEFVPPEKAACIPNPFDLATVNSEGSPIRREVMFLGWCIPAKGVEELLTAWDILQERFPDWTVRLVGPVSPEYREKLTAEHITDRVIFEGELPHEDALDRLDSAGIFTLPSHTEGFPNAVLEAMAYRKPIAATTVGAIPQMLDGAGILIPPRDPDALAQALARLMSDGELRAKLGENARRRLEEKYEMNVVFAAYQRLWKGVCR